MKSMFRYCNVALPIILFSLSTLAVEPDRSRFGFQDIDSFKDHYFTVRVSPDFAGLPLNPNGFQSIGVNVYWKIKSSDPNRGRNNYNFTQPQLPRCPFKEEKQCISGKVSFNGTSEHLEALVFTESGVAASTSIQGKYPSKALRETQFFKHRFTATGEDTSVQLGVAYYSQGSGYCTTVFCGGYQFDAMRRPGHYDYKYISVPTNDLEYLVIEVIGLQYVNRVLDTNDDFYILPVFAVKYENYGVGNVMTVRRPDWHSTTSMKDFAAFRNNDDGKGYWDSGLSNIHDNINLLDFSNIDILDVKLKYNPHTPNRADPNNTGIGVEIKKIDLLCGQSEADCGYPKLY